MRVALVAAVAAFGLRLVVLFALTEVAVVGDAAYYDQIARQLAGLLPDPPYGGFYRGFGYPLFLAGLYSLTTSYVAVRIVQALCWAVAIGLAVAIAERLFGRRVAIVVAVLTVAQLVVLPHFLYLLTENLLALELLAAIAVLVFLLPTRPVLAAAVYGVLLATLALTHLGWQLFPLFGLVLLWSPRLIAVGAAASVATALAVLGPLHAIYPNQPWHNTSGYGGYGSAWTFYVGTKTETDGLPTPEDHAAAENRLHEDSYYWKEGLRNIANDPAGSVALWLTKQWRLWGASAGAPATGSERFDRAIRNAGTVVAGLVLAWALLGLAALALARRYRLVALLGVAPLYATLVFPTFSGSGARYGFAPGLLLLIPAAYLLTQLPSLGARERAAARARPA